MKKINAIKVLSVSVIMIMLFALLSTGCGSQSKNPESTGSSETSRQSSESTGTTAPEVKELTGNVELQIFVGGYGDAWWNEMIDAFKKQNPKLNVIVSMGPKVNTQMKTRWVSDDAPDFVYCDGADSVTNQHAIDGKLMDLKDYFDSTQAGDGKSIREHILPGMITQINGGEFFAPYIFNAWSLFYDSKLMTDNSIAVPQNTDDFLAAGEALKAKGIALMDYAGMYPGYLYFGFVEPQIVAAGGKQLLEDTMTGKPGVYNSDAFKNIIKRIEAMAQKGYFLKGTTALNHTQSQMEWLNRKAAFIPNGLWVENEMKNDIPSDFVMQYTAAPLRAAGEKVSLVGSAVSMAISANTKNPEAAKAFLTHIYKDSSVKRFIEVCGAPTCYKVDTTGVNISSQMVRSCMDVLADPEVQVVTPQAIYLTEVQTMMFNQLNSIVLGKMTADEYCANLEKEAARVLASK